MYRTVIYKAKMAVNSNLLSDKLRCGW